MRGFERQTAPSAARAMPFAFLRPTLPLIAAALAACAGGPPVPDWQVKSVAHASRYTQAYLLGNERVARREFEQARQQAASTGQPEQVARVELTRCALQAASLDFAPCTGFEALREDAPPAEAAYADWLAGQASAAQAALLPAAYRAIAAANAAAPAAADAAAALKAIEDPASRLIAAGVLMRSQHASPAVAALAVETASAQGWRRPLLAWLGVQQRLAQQSGQAEEAARLRRRMDLAAPLPAAAPKGQGAPDAPGAASAVKPL